MKRLEYKEGQVLGNNGCVFIKEEFPLLHPGGQKGRIGMFICPRCGVHFKALISSIKGGNTKSCGCFRVFKSREMLTKHGLKGTPAYSKWINIKNRCYNKNSSDYPRYGGRGIRVCSKWVNDPEAFCNYVSELEFFGEPGYTIDRENNDGNYEPGNVRWSTTHVQNTNQRIRSDNTSGYVGVTLDKRTGRWIAYIQVNGRKNFLGYFDTPEEAVEARNNYIIEHGLTEYKIQEIK